MTLNWKGLWDASVLYQIGDVVYYRIDGFNYVCTSYTNGLPPVYPDSGFEKFSLTELRLIDGGLF